MFQEGYIPKVATAFDCAEENVNNPFYCQTIYNVLKKILPRDIFLYPEADEDFRADQRERFHALLPLVNYTLSDKVPANLSFYVVYKYRSKAFKFFFEMISHWLLPGKRLNVVMVYAADFKFPEIGEDLYTLCEVVLHVESKEDLEEIKRNLPVMEIEARLGVESNYYARRILEIRGIGVDEKMAMVQELVATLVHKRPHFFDGDILSEMQHLLVICREDFKEERTSRHLTRIIAIHYFFRKRVREAVKQAPEKRHLYLKIFRGQVRTLEGPKHILGFIVAVNFLKEKEVFEKRHLLKAIQNYIPGAQAIENSFFESRRGLESVCTLYIEIEKSSGEEFTEEEIRALRRALPLDLKGRIEHLMHPVFMPRNEEEIMRNILSLGNQIRFLRDIPQVIVSFDEQTHTGLFFTVILTRVTKPGAASIEELFRNASSPYYYSHDRTKIVGNLRKIYLKEATVFRIKLPKEPFLRRDNSIDLYKARQRVIEELSNVLGDVRDFNGGMISKQNELLSQLRHLLGDSAQYNELLLENFFYSLTPVAVRTLMEPHALKNLFQMLLEAVECGLALGEGYSIKMRHDPEFVYIMIKARNRAVREELSRIFSMLQVTSPDLARSYVKVFDSSYVGYIYRCDEPLTQRQFIQTIHNIIHAWEYKALSKI